MVVAANGYKAQKEAFVSNLTGGSVWEINTVTLVAPVSSASLQVDRLLRSRTADCSLTLVRPAVSTAFLHSLHACCMLDRLPSQLCGHPLRDHTLLLVPCSPEFAASRAGDLGVFHSSSCAETC